MARKTQYKRPVAGATGNRNRQAEVLPKRVETHQKLPRGKDPARMTEIELLEAINKLRTNADNRRHELLDENALTSTITTDKIIQTCTNRANTLARIRKERFD